jgi:hypothetical protein
MFSDYQFCPHCKGIRKMSVSIAMVPLDGERQGLALCLHCESCFSYVGQIPYQEPAQQLFNSTSKEVHTGAGAP